jgi:hypothetical protein
MARPYITYGGNPMLSQPYTIERVTGYGFSLDGDRKKMQALCDRTLNHNPKVRYRVATSTVLFNFLDLRELRSTIPADARKGFNREKELNVALLLVAEERNWFGSWRPRRLVWHFPYLWVDSGPVMIAGREVYGYAKEAGVITMPGAFGEQARFSGEGEVFHTFAPATPSTVLPIINARRVDGDTLKAARPWETLAEATAGFLEEIMDADLPSLLASLAMSVIRHEALLNLAFLRQLRSVENGALAAYQAIAETSFDVLRFGAAGVLEGDYEVEILKHDSVHIAAELGFASNAAGDVRKRADLAYFLELDFRLNNGRTIWAAT